MRLVSWNVAGLTSFLHRNPDLLSRLQRDTNCDVICIQETKLQPTTNKVEKINDEIGFPGWYKFHNCSKFHLGQAGVMTLSRQRPIRVTTSLSNAELDRQGRILITEFEAFIVINVYALNSGKGLLMLQKRIRLWDPKFHKLILDMNKKKPVIVAGDLNVAVQEIDIYDAGRHSRSAGFTLEERQSFIKGVLCKGFVDVWRRCHPERRQYSFYSKKFKMRQRNLGWRLDYFLIARDLWENMSVKSEILENYPDASDHLPLIMQIGN